MTMSLPVIGTNFSGQTDFMNNENSYLIRVDALETERNKVYPMDKPEKIPKDEILYAKVCHNSCNCTNFNQPSVNHLRQLMRHVYENQQEAKEKGRIAREYMVNNLSQEKMAEMVLSRFVHY